MNFTNIDPILLSPSPFAPETFEPGVDLKEGLMSEARVLVVGAGGLGCEILKNLAMMGIRNITVIDLDTIDVTNLNRQFLFRAKDVGKSKASVAAEFVMQRVPGVKIDPIVTKVQEKSNEFYRSFHIIIAGLDNVEARRHLNSVVHSLVEFDEENQPKPETVIPLIDGGTESLAGQARVIFPFKTACYECTLGTLTKPKVVNICTIATTPRTPQHCIAWAYMIEWDRLRPEDKLVAISRFPSPYLACEWHCLDELLEIP